MNITMLCLAAIAACVTLVAWRSPARPVEPPPVKTVNIVDGAYDALVESCEQACAECEALGDPCDRYVVSRGGHFVIPDTVEELWPS